MILSIIYYGLCLKTSSEILGGEIATVTDEQWAPESAGDPNIKSLIITLNSLKSQNINYEKKKLTSKSVGWWISGTIKLRFIAVF